MPGDSGLTAAFSRALLWQGLLIALVFGLLGAVWVMARSGDSGPPAREAAEPAWRRVLRIGFGVLWIFDGILQAQAAMPADFPGEVLRPAAASSPHWVRVLVDWGAANWAQHPVMTAAATVWIQVGIGLLLLASPRVARTAGLISAGWGLTVWVFGEAMGGVLSPGQTWLSGAPGAAVYYVVAGVLIALPTTPRLGRAISASAGAFLLVMAVVQAWPGRGFWQGLVGGKPGPLADLATSMARMPQPRWLSGVVGAFTALDEAHGFAVNLSAVTVLAVIAGLFLVAGILGRPSTALVALAALTALCLADWVVVQDLGFLGGLGTDPNSMIPMILLASAGYLALRPQATASAQLAITQPVRTPPATTQSAITPPATLRARLADASFRSIVAAGAAGMVVLGVVPLLITQVFTLPG